VLEFIKEGTLERHEELQQIQSKVNALIKKFQKTKDLSCFSVADDLRKLTLLLQIEYRGEKLSSDFNEIKEDLIAKLSADD
jgi:histidyl-tRNA synthetase